MSKKGTAQFEAEKFVRENPEWGFLKNDIKSDVASFNSYPSGSGYVVVGKTSKKGKKYYIYSKESGGKIHETSSVKNVSDTLKKLNASLKITVKDQDGEPVTIIDSNGYETKQKSGPGLLQGLDIAKTGKSLSQAIEKASEGNVGQATGKIEDNKRSAHLLSRIHARLREGEDLTDILDSMIDAEDPDEKISPDEKEYYFNKLSPNARTRLEGENVENAIEGRRTIIDVLKETKQRKKDVQSLEAKMLADPDVGSPEIAKIVEKIKAANPDIGDEINPLVIQRLASDGTFRDILSDNKPFHESVSKALKDALENRPTDEQIEKEFNETYGGLGNIHHEELDPIRNRIHALGNRGHAGGTYMSHLQNKEKQLQNKLDLQFKKDHFDFVHHKHASKVKGLEALLLAKDNLAKSIIGPALAREKNYRESTNQQAQNEYNEFNQEMALGEGEIKNINTSLNDSMKFNERASEDNDQFVQWVDGLKLDIDKLQGYLNNEPLLTEKEKLEGKEIEQRLWQNKIQIINLLRSSNQAEAAAQLSQATDRSAFRRIIGNMGPPLAAFLGAVGTGIATSGNYQAMVQGGLVAHALTNNALNGTPVNYGQMQTDQLFRKDNYQSINPTLQQPQQTQQPSYLPGNNPDWARTGNIYG